jgi:hypothetical protein
MQTAIVRVGQPFFIRGPFLAAAPYLAFGEPRLPAPRPLTRPCAGGVPSPCASQPADSRILRSGPVATDEAELPHWGGGVRRWP